MVRRYQEKMNEYSAQALPAFIGVLKIADASESTMTFEASVCWLVWMNVVGEVWFWHAGALSLPPTRSPFIRKPSV
jgi:hypothetical protein